MHDQLKNIDSKELDLPETVFVRDIEGKVFQSIVLRCLAQIDGVETLEGNIFDSLLGRDSLDGVKGIHVDQDQKNHSVNVRVEINVAYGVSIPEKADEVQVKIVEAVSLYTGLHVGSVHVVFKNLISVQPKESLKDSITETLEKHVQSIKSSVASHAEQFDEEF